MSKNCIACIVSPRDGADLKCFACRIYGPLRRSGIDAGVVAFLKVGDKLSIGFTGSRHGMTNEQEVVMEGVLDSIFRMAGEVEFHHGNCIGSDAKAHRMVARFKTRDTGFIIIHPCNIKRMQCAHVEAFDIREVKPPLERNRDIVEESGVMIATPSSEHEERRSGTWATIRFAKRLGKPLIIISPSGSIEAYNLPPL